MTKLGKLLNSYINPLARNLFRGNFNNSSFLIKRMIYRGFELSKKSNRQLSLLWCKENRESLEILIENEKELKLFEESKLFFKNLEKDAAKKIKHLNISMGGGGHYFLLYYLIRKLKPNVVVETGVALGFSSKAILEAINVNELGKLYSSDFPYIALHNSKRYIGYLVDDNLKSNWQLFIKGDAKNLTSICNLISTIDLFHYDSDKSYLGRYFTLKKIKNKLHMNSVIVMDDIQDNLFFKSFVEKHTCKYHVFEFEGKYSGIIENLN